MDFTFGIVTPSLNHARYIGSTIDSVLDQNYPNLEYMVMDGGSTDGTVEILRGYGSRISWSSKKDAGQADAINRGFARSGGEILGWLNSDDLYAHDSFNSVAEIFAENLDVGVVYGDADFIDAAGNFIAPCAHIEPFDNHRLIHYSDYLVQPAVFFRRSVFDSVGGLDPVLNWAMDYDLWLKLAENCRFYYLPKTLARYRWLGSGKTASAGWDRIEEVRSVAMRHGARGLPSYFVLEAVRIHLAQAAGAIKRGKVISFASNLGGAMGKLISSPRAIQSALSPRVWKIIATGRKLRRATRN